MVRVNEEIKKELSNLVREGLKDPRIDRLVTVVKVETTSDLKYCKVYVSSLDSSKVDDTVAGLKSAEGYLRRELARRINLRSTPELTFVADDSIEYSIKMSKMLRDIQVEDKDDDASDE